MEYAPGIPTKNSRLELPQTKGEVWLANIQEHLADKAGLHYDFRLLPPNNNLAYSWAVRYFPQKPGEKRLAKEVEPHTKSYLGFSGEIQKGYGKGKVISKYLDKAHILHSDPNKIELAIHHKKNPTRLVLVKIKGKDNWLIINNTPTEQTYPAIPKTKYKTITKNEVLKAIEDASIAFSPKLDGANTLVYIEKDKPLKFFSYRKSQKNIEKIDHSFKTPYWATKGDKNLIIRGELLNINNPAETAKILNSKITNLTDDQINNLQFFAFDLPQKDLTWKEKFDILKKQPFNVVPIALTKKQKKELLEQIENNKHPLTQEGLILYDWDKKTPPKKYKKTEDWDLIVKNYFLGKKGSKYENMLAGLTAQDPNSKKLIRVGTGFTDSERQEILKNFNEYKNKTIKITAQEKLPSGKFRMPVFKEWRVDEY